MSEDPTGETATVGTRPAIADEVEVRPPEREADHQTDHACSDYECRPLAFRDSFDDANDDLAKHDDREQPESLDQRVGWREADVGTCDQESLDGNPPNDPPGGL